MRVSRGNAKNGFLKSNAYPCVIRSLRVKANSVLCVLCGKWMYDRCAGVKSVTV